MLWRLFWTLSGNLWRPYVILSHLWFLSLWLLVSRDPLLCTLATATPIITKFPACSSETEVLFVSTAYHLFTVQKGLQCQMQIRDYLSCTFLSAHVYPTKTCRHISAISFGKWQISFAHPWPKPPNRSQVYWMQTKNKTQFEMSSFCTSIMLWLLAKELSVMASACQKHPRRRSNSPLQYLRWFSRYIRGFWEKHVQDPGRRNASYCLAEDQGV